MTYVLRCYGPQIACHGHDQAMDAGRPIPRPFRGARSGQICCIRGNARVGWCTDTNDSGRPMNTTPHEAHDVNAEALATLSEYLELALDKGWSVIFVRSQGGKSDVYLGDPGEPQADWARLGVIRESVVKAILETTRSGINELAIKAQTYRFVRLFTQVADSGAVVFVAA